MRLSESNRSDPEHMKWRTERIKDYAKLIECCEAWAGVTHRIIHAVLHDPTYEGRARTRAAATLLIRAIDDLDAYVILVLDGYALQGATIGSSLWEKAHCANRIGGSDEDTQTWLASGQSMDLENPFWRSKTFKKSFEEIGKALEIPVPYERATAHYEALCNAKHAHPFIMNSLGNQTNETHFTISYGPTAGSQQRLLVAEYAPKVLTAAMWGVFGFVHNNSDCTQDADGIRTDLERAVGLLKQVTEHYSKEFEESH